MVTNPIIVWTRLLGADKYEMALALTTGLEGSIYVSGYTTGSLDGQTNSGNTDAFLTKLNPDGTKVWTKLLGTSGEESATALTTGLDGSIYVSGYTTGSLDGQTNSGGTSAFLTKFNPDGTKAWTKLLSNIGGTSAAAVITGLDGSILVSGYAGGSLDGQTNSGNQDAFLTKFNSDGTKAWTRLLGTPSGDNARALTAGLDGAIYVSGYTGGSLDGQNPNGNGDAFLTKFNPDGTKVWTKLMGTNSEDIAYALTTGLDGAIYVSGYTLGSLDISTHGQTNSGELDAFLTKFNPDGTKVWTRLLGSSYSELARALTTGLDGSIYVSGWTDGSLDGQIISGRHDAFVTKFNPDGTKAWTKLMGTSGDEFSTALTTGLDGSIYVSGYTDGSLNGQIISGSADAFLVKFQEVVMPISTVASIPYGDGKYFYGSAAPDKVTGTSFVDVVKQTSTISSNQLTKLSDGSWQIQNKLSPSNSDTLVSVERIEFNDMSVALDVSGPAGQVAKILGAVFGPSYVNNTEYAGIGLAYLDDGMSYLDLCSLAADAAGLSTPDRLVTALLRNATGFEPTALSKAPYLQSISNGASYGSVVQQIADSSVNAQSIKLTDIANTGLAYKPHVLPATYSLSATSSSVNEGSNAVFNLKTSNVNVGTEVSYTLSGINFSDTAAGSLTGKVIVGTGGLSTISIPISVDGATEGQETLTINVQGATASVFINDTSKGSAIPTYTLTPVSLSANEGELAQVYVNTKNVTAGTILQFDISGVGITQGDVFEGLSRFVTVTPSWELIGRGLININTVADQLTEGPETMFITLGGSTTSIIINDTSVTLVGVPDNGGGDGGGGGGGGGAGGD
jgi:uncharacterized delta-60 repeat protein